MEWREHKIRTANLEIAFKWFGEGPGLLICLHGYGQDRNAFDLVLGQLPHGWRVICLDLPGFGESRFESGAPLLPGELFSLVEWAETQAPVARLALAGYSLGGKTALGMVMDAPRRIDAVMLLAPDGLRIHPVYRFCIYHPVGRALFRITLRYPWVFLMFLRVLIFLKLGDVFRYRFAARQLADRASRKRLREVWEGYAGFGPDKERLLQADERWKPRWEVLWGDRDGVVPPKFGAEFATWIPDAQFHELKGGHLLLRDCAVEVGQRLNEMLSRLW